MKAALEKVSVQFVPTIEALGVEAVQSLHPRRKILPRRLEKQVEVVSHQAIRMAFPRGVTDDAGEQAEEAMPIVVVEKTGWRRLPRAVTWKIPPAGR